MTYCAIKNIIYRLLKDTLVTYCLIFFSILFKRTFSMISYFKKSCHHITRIDRLFWITTFCVVSFIVDKNRNTVIILTFLIWLLSSPLTQSILLAIQRIRYHANVFLLHRHWGYILLRISNNPTSLQLFLIELVIVLEINMINKSYLYRYCHRGIFQ